MTSMDERRYSRESVPRTRAPSGPRTPTTPRALPSPPGPPGCPLPIPRSSISSPHGNLQPSPSWVGGQELQNEPVDLLKVRRESSFDPPTQAKVQDDRRLSSLAVPRTSQWGSPPAAPAAVRGGYLSPELGPRGDHRRASSSSSPPARGHPYSTDPGRGAPPTPQSEHRSLTGSYDQRRLSPSGPSSAILESLEQPLPDSDAGFSHIRAGATGAKAPGVTEVSHEAPPLRATSQSSAETVPSSTPAHGQPSSTNAIPPRPHPEAPPLPKRTADVRLYATEGLPVQHHRSRSSISNAPSHLPSEPSPVPPSPLPAEVAQTVMPQPPPAPLAIVTQIAPEPSPANAAFSPTASSDTSSDFTDHPQNTFAEDEQHHGNDHSPPPYAGRSNPSVQPAAVRDASRQEPHTSPTTTTSLSSPSEGGQTSIIARDAAITRMDTVRTSGRLQPAEVLAVAAAANQQAATVRETIPESVSEPEADSSECKFHSGPPHLTVIGSGCFLLAYDYRPGPVAEWDSPVRVILNSKSQEVVIHEHQNTPKWRADETREYIKVLIELHNEVVEEIDDSYAAFGSRGGEGAGLGVGAQIRTEGPSVTPSSGRSVPATPDLSTARDQAAGAVSPSLSLRSRNTDLAPPAYVPNASPPAVATTPSPRPSLARVRQGSRSSVGQPISPPMAPQQPISPNRSVSVTGPHTSVSSHRIALLSFAMEGNGPPPAWLTKAIAYLMSDQQLVIDCHEGTPEQLRGALVGAFGTSYGVLCRDIAEIEQALVNCFPGNPRLRNLEISVPDSVPPHVARLVININTANAAIPPNPWIPPRISQTGPFSFHLVFPPRPGSGGTVVRRVSAELNPPMAAYGSDVPPQFKSYVDLVLLALRTMFGSHSTASPLLATQPTLGIPGTQGGSPRSRSPASALSNGSNLSIASAHPDTAAQAGGRTSLVPSPAQSQAPYGRSPATYSSIQPPIQAQPQQPLLGRPASTAWQQSPPQVNSPLMTSPSYPPGVQGPAIRPSPAMQSVAGGTSPALPPGAAFVPHGQQVPQAMYAARPPPVNPVFQQVQPNVTGTSSGSFTPQPPQPVQQVVGAKGKKEDCVVQ